MPNDIPLHFNDMSFVPIKKYLGRSLKKSMHDMSLVYVMHALRKKLNRVLSSWVCHKMIRWWDDLCHWYVIYMSLLGCLCKCSCVIANVIDMPLVCLGHVIIKEKMTLDWSNFVMSFGMSLTCRHWTCNVS
jgi:hypothetical protein